MNGFLHIHLMQLHQCNTKGVQGSEYFLKADKGNRFLQSSPFSQPEKCHSGSDRLANVTFTGMRVEDSELWYI